MIAEGQPNPSFTDKTLGAIGKKRKSVCVITTRMVVPDGWRSASKTKRKVPWLTNRVLPVAKAVNWCILT